MSELDAELLLSTDHPLGQLLHRLLEVGDRHVHATRSRKTTRANPSVAVADVDVKRFRAGDMYDLVKGHRDT